LEVNRAVVFVVLSMLAGCGGSDPPPAATTPTTPADPVLTAVPKALCGPGSNPETGMQGRVPKEEVDSGRAAEGYSCNIQLLGRIGEDNYAGGAGGFKVHRYVDAAGHECGYYDTTLLYPGNVSAGQVPGVWVLDMADPANPAFKIALASQAMLSPHESLVLHQGRGLIIAAYGTPATAPGQVDIYSLEPDCRSPQLQSSLPVGTLGHEGTLAPDGKTYYIASLDGGTMTAIDITIANAPVPLFEIVNKGYKPHGMSISADGNRMYLADRAGLIIFDTSQVQARVFNPAVPEISRLSWEPIQSTPQATIPVTIQGHSYLIEFDEFSDSADNAGAGRIIDIANEMEPKIVSNIRLEVHAPENRAALLGDYGAGASDKLGFMGYNAHYCEVPQRVEPGILACTMILSGLRVFDIRDPFNPKEVAYFNGPILTPSGNPEWDPSSYAMSAPAFVPARKEIWYSDGSTGFYALRVTNGAWPD
jgi:hypothetical protein